MVLEAHCTNRRRRDELAQRAPNDPSQSSSEKMQINRSVSS
jgi:hypothetical protein